MNKAFTPILFLILTGASLIAQPEATKDEKLVFESGKGLYEDKLYSLAYERFKKVLEKHPDDLYVKYLTGVCGVFISDKHEEALAFLTEVKQKNKKAADIDYYFALLYHRMYQFDKSIELCNKLLENPKLNPEQRAQLKQTVENCNNGKMLVQSPVQARIENIGSPPNTDAAEYAPVVTGDEETMLFTYRGPESTGGLRDMNDKPNQYGFYYEDIFMTKKVNGKWQKPESIGENNTESNDAVIALSNDGQQLFIFRANETDGGDIYVSTLNGSAFGVAEKLRGDINTSSWEGSISLSGDQKHVVFASERPGGNGGKDLYQSTKSEDGSWGPARNLGNNINTALDEDAPFLHPDGRTLVFSSKGHNSMGEFDIFLSDFNVADSSWQKPVNAGYPVNTTDDDIYYVLSVDGKRGYYASAKTGGFGDKDIYVVEPGLINRKSYVTVIKGKVTENNAPYLGEVAVVIANGSKNYGTFRSNSASGNYLLSLPSGINYKITFTHPKYGEKSFDVMTEKVDGYAEKIVDVNFDPNDPAAKHETIVLETKDTTATGAVAATTKPAETKPAETKPADVKPEETKPSGGETTSSETDIKKMSRAQLFNKFGESRVNGLKYVVQVGAYRHPENYRAKKLSSVCSTKQAGVIMSDVNLIITDKEFESWKEADAFLQKVKSLGQSDAFLTANYNGKRYYLKDLLDLGVWTNSVSAADTESSFGEETVFADGPDVELAFSASENFTY